MAPLFTSLTSDMFKPIAHQFTLFDYNQMRPRIKVPIKRISKERMEEAMRLMKKGKPRNLLEVLRGLNDDLSNYEKRIKVKPRQ